MIIDYNLDASVKLFLFNQEEYPDSWHAYYDLAFSYKLKGEIDLAKIAILKAQEIDPNNMDVRELLNDLEKEE